MQITKTLVEHIYRYDGRYTNAENKKKAVYLLFHNWLYYRNFTCSRGGPAREGDNRVAQLVVLANKGKGGQALAPREPQKSLVLYVLFPAGKSTKKRPAQGPIKITSKREIL